jgi:hypothetical protein
MYGDRRKERELCLRSGYRKDKFGKFLELRPNWDKSRGDVPLAYLHAIGARKELLEAAAQVDLATFHHARRQHTTVPTHYFVQNVLWCRPTFEIPGHPVTEAAAIRALIQELLKKRKQHPCIVEVTDGQHHFRQYRIEQVETTPTDGRFQITRSAYERRL